MRQQVYIQQHFRRGNAECGDKEDGFEAVAAR
jgi:hypothetical protein